MAKEKLIKRDKSENKKPKIIFSDLDLRFKKEQELKRSEEDSINKVKKSKKAKNKKAEVEITTEE